MQTFWERLLVPRPVMGLEGSSGPLEESQPCPPPLVMWQSLARQGLSPFAPAFATVAGMHAPYLKELPFISGVWSGSYLPIEALREQDLSLELFRSPSIARTFLSSGTTAAHRSTSRYSAWGLTAYRWASLYTFRYVLGRVLGTNPALCQGLSLIPPTMAWPDSSLAQMVEWIGEVLPCRYINPDDFLRLDGDPEAFLGANHDQPVWLFATAFHLVDLIDSGKARSLPPGSVVIETGGTKGRTRSVSRQELFAMIDGALGVPADRIISEYGMCELASQAYDFVDSLEKPSEGNRCFRFPAWVRIAALPSVGVAMESGLGALTIADPLRTDLPWPLRTEDLVDVPGDRNHQVFHLQGRIERAPLKGCSLLAEGHVGQLSSDTSDHENQPPGSTVRSWGSLLIPQPDAMARRAKALLEALARWRRDPELTLALTREFRSRRVAEAAISDMYNSIPQVAEDLVAAALRSQVGGIAASWVLVLPSSHSLVGPYPLVMGYILGLRIAVRVPASLNHAGSFLDIFLSLLKSLPESMISLLPPGFRVGDGADLGDAQAVLAYGEDSTITQIQSLAKIPVRGFGGRIGLSVASEESLGATSPLIARDVLSLGQQGCMATRVLLLLDQHGAMQHERVAGLLADALGSFWDSSWPQPTLVSHDMEAFRLQRLGFRRHHQPGRLGPLIALRITDLQELHPQFLLEAAARVALSLPVAIVTGYSPSDVLHRLGHIVAQWPSLAMVSLAPAGVSELTQKNPNKSYLFRSLGEANVPRWDGFHEGFPLFSGSVIS